MGVNNDEQWRDRFKTVCSEIRASHPHLTELLRCLEAQAAMPDRAEPAYRKAQAIHSSGNGNVYQFAAAVSDTLLFCMPAAQYDMVVQQQKVASDEAEHHLHTLTKRLDDQLGGALKRADDAAQAAVDAARSAGADMHVGGFEARARSHEEASFAWLAAVILGSVAWGAGALWSAWKFQADTPWPVVAIRLVALSAGLALIGFFVKAYGANRHNAIVNQHRATSLSTMKAFITATTDEATKNAVIQQVTAGTFATLPTGYEGAAGFSGTKAIDLLKAAKESR